jgi:hypothetical protein
VDRTQYSPRIHLAHINIMSVLEWLRGIICNSITILDSDELRTAPLFPQLIQPDVTQDSEEPCLQVPSQTELLCFAS